MTDHRGVVSIGTTHPWNVAGVGLDLRIAARLGVEVFTVVAALSAQDAHGIRALHPVPLEMLRAQLATLPLERVGALRIGALVGAAGVEVVAEFVARNSEIVAVVDPVLGATRGGDFADEATLIALRDTLARAPSVVLTPNLAEAAALLGRREISAQQMDEAAGSLRARGALAVLLKGGHLAGDPTDVLADAEGVAAFPGTRLRSTLGGTGCMLAMVLACGLARGEGLREAVDEARAYVRQRLVRHA